MFKIIGMIPGTNHTFNVTYTIIKAVTVKPSD